MLNFKIQNMHFLNPPKPDELVVMNWPLATSWEKALKEEVSDAFTILTGIPVRHEETTGLDFPPKLPIVMIPFSFLGICRKVSHTGQNSMSLTP